MLGQVGISILEKLSTALAPVAIHVADQSHLHAGHAGARPQGESHFSVSITAPAFAGKRPVERHRMVNAVLAAELISPVHALAIKAAAPKDGTELGRIEAGDPRLAALLAESGLAADDDDALFVGLTRDDRLLASGGVELCGSSALLRSIAVAGEARGAGHGMAMVMRLIAEARVAGASDVWLLTAGAEGFFANAGFVATPREMAPAALRAASQFNQSRCASATAMRRRAGR